MAMSVEARALRRCNEVFKSGADPENLVTVLYSDFLLTPDERERVRHPNKTPGQQLEELFTTLERRVSVTPGEFHKLTEVLGNEPATKPLAEKMKEKYAQEKASNGTQPTAAQPATAPETAQNGGRGMRRPTQLELMDNVKVSKWYPFSLSLLQGDDETVNTIEEDSALKRTEDKLREVFRIWLKTSKNPTWNAVVAALRSVKNNRLAGTIETKFC